MQEECMDDNSHELQQLLEIIARIAVGDYSNDIMGLTTDTTPEPIRTIAEAMGLMMVKVEAREFHLEQLVAELQRLNTQIKHNTVQTVAAMAQALEARDSYTRGHAERVAEIAAQIALEMGFDEKRVELVRTAGVLHDIGKIGISDTILLKPGRLTPEERVIMETHVDIGSNILAGAESELLEVARIIALTHHEKWDGTGYPNRLSGEAIPLEGRITAIADVFDALTSERPYKQAWPVDQAVAYLKENAGLHFDPVLVEMFLSILPDVLTVTGNFKDQ